MKNKLAENMLRFGVKNLTESNISILREGSETNIGLYTKGLDQVNNRVAIELGGKDYPIELGSTVNSQIILQSYGNQAAKVGNSNPSVKLETFDIKKYHPSKAALSAEAETIGISSPFKAGDDIPAWHEVINPSKYGRSADPRYSGFKLGGGVELNTEGNVNYNAGTLSNGEPNNLPTMLYYVIPINFKITPEFAEQNEKHRNSLRILQRKARERNITTAEQYTLKKLREKNAWIANVLLRAGNLKDTRIPVFFNRQSIVGFDVTDPR